MSEDLNRKRPARNLQVETVPDEEGEGFGEYGEAVLSFGSSEDDSTLLMREVEPAAAPGKKVSRVSATRGVGSTKSAPGGLAGGAGRVMSKSDPVTNVVLMSKRDLEVDFYCRGLIGDGAKFCSEKRADCRHDIHKGKKHRVKKDSYYIRAPASKVALFCKPCLPKVDLLDGDSLEDLISLK